MQCLFCEGEIRDYRLTTFDIITSAEHKPFPSVATWDGAIYVGKEYPAALIECPHCDSVFFLKASSKRLDDMNLIIEDPNADGSEGNDEDAICRMTPEEKTALYEQMKKALKERYL